jgi:hypothetical protein
MQAKNGNARCVSVFGMSQFLELGFVFGNEVSQGMQESVKGIGVTTADNFSMYFHSQSPIFF